MSSPVHIAIFPRHVNTKDFTSFSFQIMNTINKNRCLPSYCLIKNNNISLNFNINCRDCENDFKVIHNWYNTDTVPNHIISNYSEGTPIFYYQSLWNWNILLRPHTLAGRASIMDNTDIHYYHWEFLLGILQ